MFDEIPNDALCEEQLPPPNSDWNEGIRDVALTFDGYAHVSSARCVAIARTWRTRYEQQHALSFTLTELRIALFFEQRVWRWNDDHLAQPESMPYIHALLEAIRAKVRARQLE